MKTTKLTYEAVFNLGNYQTVRLGGEYTLEPNEAEADAYVKIDQRLRETAKAIVADRVAEATRAKEQAAQVATAQVTTAQAQPAQAVQEKKEEKVKVEKIVVRDDETELIGKIGDALAKKIYDGKMTVEQVSAEIDKWYDVSPKVRSFWQKAIEIQNEI